LTDYVVRAKILEAVLQIGKGVVRRSGKDVALVGYGTIVNDCLAAADDLAKLGISTTVVDARFCKPLDKKLLLDLAANHAVLITVEENTVGGFGSHGALSDLTLRGGIIVGVYIKEFM
jgi:1-deoxy-D-xylulose-5-phosphate synthase